MHKPIIDKETWNIVQNSRKNNLPPVQNNNKIQNPLLGLIFCEKCGKPMQRRPYNLKQKEAILICNNPNCSNISSKLFIVEEQIIKALRMWLKNYYVDYSRLNDKDTTIIKSEDILKQLESKLLNEKNKLNKVYELFEEGTYNKEEFSERSIRLKNNINVINGEIAKIHQLMLVQKETNKNKDIIIPQMKNVIDIYSELETNEQKNILLKSIIEKVTYLKTEKAIKKGSKPSNFEIHIYPKIPKF